MRGLPPAPSLKLRSPERKREVRPVVVLDAPPSVLEPRNRSFAADLWEFTEKAKETRFSNSTQAARRR